MKIFGIFILVVVMASTVQAAEERSVEEIKTLADKFAVCYGTCGGYAETQRKGDLTELFQGHARGAKLASLILLTHAHRLKTGAYNNEEAVSLLLLSDQFSPYVEALGHGEFLKIKAFMGMGIRGILEAKEMLGLCVEMTRLQANILQEFRKLMYDLP